MIQTLSRAIQVAASVLIILAVSVMLNFTQSNIPKLNIVSFFSYFTIQSNLIVAAFFLIRPPPDIFRKLRINYDMLRGGLTLYLGITTIVYWAILHRLINMPTGPAWTANIILHSVAWCILILDFWRQAPTQRLESKVAVYWLAYPLIYTIYTMIRGSIVDWYPYPFMNPQVTGSGLKTLVIFTLMGLTYWLFGLGIVRFNNTFAKLKNS